MEHLHQNKKTKYHKYLQARLCFDSAFYQKENGMLNCRSLIEGLSSDIFICKSFEWLTKGQNAEVELFGKIS